MGVEPDSLNLHTSAADTAIEQASSCLRKARIAVGED
jgi:hypothetical protein